MFVAAAFDPEQQALAFVHTDQQNRNRLQTCCCRYCHTWWWWWWWCDDMMIFSNLQQQVSLLSRLDDEMCSNIRSWFQISSHKGQGGNESLWNICCHKSRSSSRRCWDAYIYRCSSSYPICRCEYNGRNG